MDPCEVCGNRYDKSFYAIVAVASDLAPTCASQMPNHRS